MESELPRNLQTQCDLRLVPLATISQFPPHFLSGWFFHYSLLSMSSMLQNFADEVPGHYHPIIVTYRFNPKDILTETLGKLDLVEITRRN